MIVPGGVREFLEKELDQFFQTISHEDLCLLRDWLRECDPVGDWPVEERLPRLRARVMKVVLSGDVDAKGPRE